MPAVEKYIIKYKPVTNDFIIKWLNNMAPQAINDAGKQHLSQTCGGKRYIATTQGWVYTTKKINPIWANSYSWVLSMGKDYEVYYFKVQNKHLYKTAKIKKAITKIIGEVEQFLGVCSDEELADYATKKVKRYELNIK